jgi:hypothetical protein
MALSPNIILTPTGDPQHEVVKRFRNSLLSLQGKDEQTLATERNVLSNKLLSLNNTTQQQQNEERDQNSRLRSIALFANDITPSIEAGDLATIVAKTRARIPQLKAEGKIPDDSIEFLQMLENKHLTDDQKLREAQRIATQAKNTARVFGVIGADLTSAQKERAELQRILDTATDQLSVSQRYAAIDAGLLPRQVGSAAQTIAAQGTAPQVAASESIIAGSTERAKGDAEVETERNLNEILADRAAGNKIAETEATRIDDYISRGLNAVDRLPKVRRGIELLKKVKTGGIAAKEKVVTDFFGTTSGDVAELSNILAENVLAGLSAFSGAISEGEREFIREMETGIIQGTEFNTRQLSRMENMLSREVDRAIKAAESTGDQFALDMLKNPDATGVLTRKQQLTPEQRQARLNELKKKSAQ